MPENATTRVLTEANLVTKLAPLFINPADAPYNVKFDGNPANATANTTGLQAAFNMGGFIQMPRGTAYIIGDLSVGSYTHVAGQGEGVTVLKIENGRGWDRRGIIFAPGTTRSSLRHLTVDGNQPNRNLANGSGGIKGTNVSIVNSTYIHVEHVASINAVQHCFDVTSSYYGDAGDGATIPDPSEYVWLTDCFADQSGDDCFTTHGSGKIWLTRCTAMGTWKKTLTAYTNSNGFEFDDYSYDVTATDCFAANCAHGFEIKAHGNMSAGQNVRLIGCIAERNETNFSLRHIGHHVNYPGNPAVLSLTAKNVQLIGCTSKHPRQVFIGGVDTPDGDTPDDQTPPGDNYRALSVGAYRGVTVTNFHAIGDPAYNYAGSSPILVHYLAEDFILNGYHVEGHTTSNWDVYCVGGNQPASNVTIVNGVHRDSAIGGVSCGGSSNATIQNISLSRTVAGSTNGIGIRAYGNKTVRSNRFVTPYGPNYSISDTAYSTYETPMATNVAA